MGYANYWCWKTPLADADKFAEWSSDVQYLLDELSTPDRELPPYAYRGGPSAYRSGYIPVFYCTHNSGPSGRGEPVITPTKVAFNGNASIEEDCEPFIITLRDLKAPNLHASCKTRAKPYDLLVICALVRLAHYFPDVPIYSDREEHTIPMAVRICREVFGDNILPVVDSLQDKEECLPGKVGTRIIGTDTSWPSTDFLGLSHKYMYASRIAESYLISGHFLSGQWGIP